MKRIRGRELQRLRSKLLLEHPWCEACLLKDRKTRATIRDHKVPLQEGGTEDESNTIAVCLNCADIRSEAEAQRGVRPSALAPSFRKRATPRNEAGQFADRRRPF